MADFHACDRWFPADQRFIDRMNGFALSGFANLVGWIFPDGGVVFTSTFGHRDALPKSLQERYGGILERIQHEIDEQVEWEAENSTDSHPAWHRFNADGDANLEFLHELVQLGYLRFGCWLIDGEARMEVSGTPALVDRHDTTLRAMVAEGQISEVFLDNTVKRKRYRLKNF